jgi:hypothetical protein
LTVRRINTLIEDEAHKMFLHHCISIVSELNGECETTFELTPMNCHGKYELVANRLPSFLELATKRFLLVLDLDDKSETCLINWIVGCIKNARTKQFSHTIKVVDQHKNVINVIMNKQRKMIVILPLGLNRKLLSTIRTHSVEDYCLVQIPQMLKGKHTDNSKNIMNELLFDNKITKQQIQTFIEKSINDHRNLISNYLRPLWDAV